RRVRGADAPVELVDMRDELTSGNRQPLSRRLLQVVEQTLENEEQAILYLNRRGMATFVMCRECGKSVQCLGCSVALVQHAEIEGLICHYCGYSRAMPATCDHCGSRQVRALGMGTQRLEGMVKKLWPRARVLRLDSDAEQYSVRGAATNDHEGFYESALPTRQAFTSPHCADLAVLTRSDADDGRAAASAREAAEAIATGLLKEGVEGIRVMGPSPAFIHRLRGEYRWQVTLKGSGLERARFLAPRGRGWSFDVDPTT